MKKAAFLKAGSFSHINNNVFNELTKNFPDFQFDVIDLMPDIYSWDFSLALYHCLREYGNDIIFGKKTLIATFDRTSYYLKKRRKFILDNLTKNRYDFTFQTQSKFDGSIPGVPHFLYTDHTHLANLNYPGFDRSLLLNDQWVDFEAKIYQNATLNFTMSSNISKSVIEDYSCNPEKVVCVYCGSNVKVEECEIFESNRFLKKNILFVGLDWNRKGGPVLAEAFKTIVATYPDATLTIVGCNPRLNLPNTRVLGKVDISKVMNYYNEASIFCLPTTLEPFGIVFLEAMAHKLPVVATNIGAIPDFIHDGKNGYLVDPNNAELLSEALMKLLGSEEKCGSFGEYGHRIFSEQYTWEKTGLRLRDHIMQFVG